MIGIIDYGAGNNRSVANALKKIGVDYFISRDIAELKAASKLILPGVGEAGSAMESLNGVADWLPSVKVPFLGICLGLQLMFEKSAERETTGLGIFIGSVARFTNGVKIPHMGWNHLLITRRTPLLNGIADEEYFYFVHSYYAPPVLETVGVTQYGDLFSSVIQKDNFYGVQFHPEKSGKAGLHLLSNFVNEC